MTSFSHRRFQTIQALTDASRASEQHLMRWRHFAPGQPPWMKPEIGDRAALNNPSTARWSWVHNGTLAGRWQILLICRDLLRRFGSPSTLEVSEAFYSEMRAFRHGWTSRKRQRAARRRAATGTNAHYDRDLSGTVNRINLSRYLGIQI